jgi:hypothetical protein
LVMQGVMLEWVVLSVCCFSCYLCCNFVKWRHWWRHKYFGYGFLYPEFLFHLHIFRFWNLQTFFVLFLFIFHLYYFLSLEKETS